MLNANTLKSCGNTLQAARMTDLNHGHVQQNAMRANGASRKHF
jgi:hypothetical protein